MIIIDCGSLVRNWGVKPFQEGTTCGVLNRQITWPDDAVATRQIRHCGFTRENTTREIEMAGRNVPGKYVIRIIGDPLSELDTCVRQRYHPRYLACRTPNTLLRHLFYFFNLLHKPISASLSNSSQPYHYQHIFIQQK